MVGRAGDNGLLEGMGNGYAGGDTKTSAKCANEKLKVRR